MVGSVESRVSIESRSCITCTRDHSSGSRHPDNPTTSSSDAKRSHSSINEPSYSYGFPPEPANVFVSRTPISNTRTDQKDREEG